MGTACNTSVPVPPLSSELARHALHPLPFNNAFTLQIDEDVSVNISAVRGGESQYI